MLKRILVGLNGSPYSRAAGEFALELASRHCATIIALGVVDTPRITRPEPVPLGGMGSKVLRDAVLVEVAEERATELLSDFEQQCTQRSVPCRTTKLEGDPEKLLAREAQRVDLLVMGKKSVHSEPGAVASHVLRQTLRNATRPVLCVCDSAHPAWNRKPVLIAYDGSPQAARTLQIFQATGLSANRPVHLFAAASDSVDRRTIGLAAEFLKVHDYCVETHFSSSKASIGGLVLSAAKEIDAGLIVMGAYGESPVRQLLFGSVTRTVLRDSELPLFLYH